MRDNQVELIRVNAGLFTTAPEEDEFASVLAHELGHLAQRHYARRMERVEETQLPTMAAMLAGMVLAAGGGGSAGIAAMMGTQAAFIQDHALKEKRVSALGTRLPSLADCEFFELRLLGICAAIMVVGLITGMAVQYFETGSLLTLDHKTLLSLLTFAVITALLYARHRSGLRGRRAARLALLAWLLLTLGYPGVKFVTDVLMS